MIKYVEILMLLALIGLAIAAIEGIKIRRAIVYMGGFSLMSSFVYLLYLAPDVAIAEAVIGCTISVILLLTALKKQAIMTIYYVNEDKDKEGNELRSAFCSQLRSDLDRFLISNEFEPQMIRTSLDDVSLHEKEDFDLLIVNSGNFISIYSDKNNYHTPLIGGYIDGYNKGDNIVEFIPLAQENDYEG